MIVKEEQKQKKDKIGTIVNSLQSKNGLNIPNMWDIVKKIKGRKVEPRTAIKAKDGTIIEDPELIKERYLEHFIDILKNKEAVTEKQVKQEELIDIAFNQILEIAQNKETVFTSHQ